MGRQGCRGIIHIDGIMEPARMGESDEIKSIKGNSEEGYNGYKFQFQVTEALSLMISIVQGIY